MNLNQLGKNWENECKDIKNRPKLYLLKISALIIFVISYYLIMSPFLNNVENHIQKMGYLGMILIIGSICFKKIIPQTILAFCNGEIIFQIDNINDIKKINCFYLIVLPCAFLLVLFIKQLKESLNILFYVRTDNQ